MAALQWPARPLIDTGLQPGAYRAKGFLAVSTAFFRDVCSSKPLKRLIRSIRMFTGLKAGVNDKRRRHCKAAVVAEH